MPTTFVTAFLDLREDRRKDKSWERCGELFQKIAATGIPIHCFISASVKESLQLPESPHIHYECIELEDLDTYKSIHGLEYTIPQTNTPHHDTTNFMVLMNAKTEFMQKAIEQDIHQTTHFAWIDFSIFHVFKHDPAAASNTLQTLAYSALQPRCLFFPGCWGKGWAADRLFDQINWRFCGGFFLGDRESVLMLSRFHGTFFPAIVQKHKRLVWETNIWHYLELHRGLHLDWYLADHNERIIELPRSAFRVVASLTTIPSRITTSCRLTIDSLLTQVEHIYMSIPHVYDRFGPFDELPAYLTGEPYKSKVTLVRGPDYGPASKYIGAISQLPNHTWVFVCDDDQEYHPQLIARMKESIRAPAALYQNHFASIKLKTSGGLVHGYVGNLVPANFLKRLADFPLPEAARFVDDQWMSIACHKLGLQICPTVAEQYHEIFKVLEHNHEKLGIDSLAGLANRDAKVEELAAWFRVKFVQDQIIDLPSDVGA
jgi:hypothetical protein